LIENKNIEAKVIESIVGFLAAYIKQIAKIKVIAKEKNKYSNVNKFQLSFQYSLKALFSFILKSYYKKYMCYYNTYIILHNYLVFFLGLTFDFLTLSFVIIKVYSKTVSSLLSSFKDFSFSV
jgi:hypothetical protein